MPLEKLPDGRWRVRLRYGAGLRERFIVIAKDDAAAQRKADRMQIMANRLARHGKHVEAKAVLQEAGLTTTETDLLEVEQVVTELCAEAKAEGAVPKGPARTTFGDVAELLFERHVREGNSLSTLKKDRQRLRVIYPRIGAVPVADITRKIADEAMALVPADVQAGRNLYEGLIYRVLKLAVRMELIDAIPLRSDFVSRQPAPKKLFQYLRVDEEFDLITCRRIPLERRVGYALMSREGVRPEFLSLFFWSDRVDPDAKVSTLDLESGLLTHRHKQKKVRRWQVCERVLRVMAAWREKFADSDRVLPDWDHRNVATKLRRDLLDAGVSRPALHRTTATERQIGAKDAGRATFVTLALRAGAPMHWVTDRTGHATEEMVERYTRMARESRDTVRAWLRPMDEAFGPELGIEPLTGYVAPWLQGIPVSDDWSVNAMGLQLGHLAELLKQSGKLAPAVEDTRYSPGSRHALTQEPESASSSASSSTKPTSGPAGFLLVGQAGPAGDPVELALAVALEAATRAERWDVVLAVTAELRERRLARVAPDVPSLESARRRRDEGGGK